VHAGEPRPGVGDAISMPLFHSSTYVLGEPESFHDIRYVRLNNTPNQLAVSEKIAALEGAEEALVTPSGTAAISMALLGHLSAGDHVIAAERIYGGTRKVLDLFADQHGIDVTYVDLEAPETWAAALTGRSKVFYVESITNPLLSVGPLDEVVRFCRSHGVVSMIDNTLATPTVFRPLEVGFDVSLHSASKYLNGHSDVVAGAVAASAAILWPIRKKANLLGVCLDPHACFLLQRGLKTMPLRVQAQNASALRLAKFLSERTEVLRVMYPGLPGSVDFRRASRWFEGFGAMISFEIDGGLPAAEAFLGSLQYAQIAPSMGGVETLVCRPATTSHAGMPSAERRRLGVADALVRVSVGLEDFEDLRDDFAHALTRAGRSARKQA
jgi:cystathionine beta-lyase/cystathionine gamma-synthase